jgi:hypothetical protein
VKDQVSSNALLPESGRGHLLFSIRHGKDEWRTSTRLTMISDKTSTIAPDTFSWQVEIMHKEKDQKIQPRREYLN